MEPHVKPWIPAYYDGELHGDRLAQVEAHLESCQICREELADLQSLSALLNQAPVPVFRAPDPGWAAGLDGPRRATQPATGWQRALKAGWIALPFALITIWALFQASLLLAGLAEATGLDGGFVLQTLTGFVLWPSLSSLAGRLLVEELAAELFQTFPALVPAAATVQAGLLDLAVTALIGVFLWSWIASWWVYQKEYKRGPL